MNIVDIVPMYQLQDPEANCTSNKRQTQHMIIKYHIFCETQ